AAGTAVKFSEGLALTFDFRHRSVGSAQVEYDAASGFTVTKLSTNSFTAGFAYYVLTDRDREPDFSGSRLILNTGAVNTASICGSRAPPSLNPAAS
ncbi:MAG: hypothetical protein C0515_12765, partial [Novosphingobium sp.]|nr:hypothetical protein [Novosphingobium sp.]